MMESQNILILISLEAIKTEIEGMKWANEERKMKGESLAYTENDFFKMADLLRRLLKS